MGRKVKVRIMRSGGREAMVFGGVGASVGCSFLFLRSILGMQTTRCGQQNVMQTESAGEFSNVRSKYASVMRWSEV